MEFDKVKDSGVREDMETGSRRDTQKGKSRPDLNNPLVIRRLGMHMANGCDKYGEHNYELGQKTSRYLASLERHLLDYKEGLDDEDHAAAIMWNIHGIIMNQEFVERGIYPAEMDDYCDYRTKQGFDCTVGARARGFNDNLRKAEDTISYVTYGTLEEDTEEEKRAELFDSMEEARQSGQEVHSLEHGWDVIKEEECHRAVPKYDDDEGQIVCGCNLCVALKNDAKIGPWSREDEHDQRVSDDIIAEHNARAKSKCICNTAPGSCDAQAIDDEHEGCDIQFICLADFDNCKQAERKFE